MVNKRRVRNTVLTCTNTTCFKRDCPNHTPRLKPNSIGFTSCINWPKDHEEIKKKFTYER